MTARYVATLLALSLALMNGAKATADSVGGAPASGYQGRCALCHEGHGFGVQRMRARLGEEFSLLTRRSDLTAPFIRQVVRNGFLAMPPMSRVEVPERELEEIIRYLTQPNAGAQ